MPASMQRLRKRSRNGRLVRWARGAEGRELSERGRLPVLVGSRSMRIIDDVSIIVPLSRSESGSLQARVRPESFLALSGLSQQLASCIAGQLRSG